MGMSVLPRYTPTRSDRKLPASLVHPPMTTSCPLRTLALVHVSPRPERYGASRRLEMIPSSDNSCAERSTASPAPSRWPTYRMRERAAPRWPRRIRSRRFFLSTSGRSRRSRPPAKSKSKAKNTISAVLPSESPVCSAAKLGLPAASSATTSPSITVSGSPSAARAIALNFLVQFSPLRVDSVTVPFWTRSCMR